MAAAAGLEENLMFFRWFQNDISSTAGVDVAVLGGICLLFAVLVLCAWVTESG
jgi:hypothetical protein